MWPISIRPGLSPEDEEVKQKLFKCHPWTYSKLIRSDILRPSGAKSSQPPSLRPSPPSVMKPTPSFVMKPSHGGPPVVKPIREELQARVEASGQRRRGALSEELRPPLRATPRLG